MRTVAFNLLIRGNRAENNLRELPGVEGTVRDASEALLAAVIMAD